MNHTPQKVMLTAQQLEQLKQTQRTQQLNLKYRPQVQPLGQSHQQNTQQMKVREAQAARMRISQRKSVLMEDDREFCPTSPEVNVAKRGIMGQHSMSMSPYTTPVKMNKLQQGYMSPMMSSPQQMYHTPMRRLEVPNTSPMYMNNNSRW